MTRFDLINTAIASTDSDSRAILGLFNKGDARETPRYSSASRRRARARRYG